MMLESEPNYGLIAGFRAAGFDYSASTDPRSDFPRTAVPGDVAEVRRLRTFWRGDRIRGATFVAGNCGSARAAVVTKIAEVFPVFSLGSCRPKGTTHAKWEPAPANLTVTKLFKPRDLDKIAAISRYTHHLAFENSVSDGYVTEKIWTALAAGAIPIYWGASDVKRFIGFEPLRVDDVIRGSRTSADIPEGFIAPVETYKCDVCRLAAAKKKGEPRPSVPRILRDAVTWDDLGAFVVTGDIPNMWTRDSVASVLPYCDTHRALCFGVLKRLAFYLREAPYANSYRMKSRSARGREVALKREGFIATYNYELDSGCWWLLLWNTLGAPDAHAGTMRLLVDLYSREPNYTYPEVTAKMRHVNRSAGLVWSAFRPSDDPMTYGFHVPSQFFLVHVLRDHAYAKHLRNRVRWGLDEHATQNGRYCYEVDGFGACNIMDDANIPNLLALPLYAPGEYDETIDIPLSLTSPHTPKGWIWPLAEIADSVVNGGDPPKPHASHPRGFVESYDPGNPRRFTRSWFVWPNAFFEATRVDPFIGTRGVGHTAPGAKYPFGMIYLTPVNVPKDWWAYSAGYQRGDGSFRGIAHTAMSGAGIPGLLDVLISPHPHPARIQAEHARPGWYAAEVDGIHVEVTAGNRFGVHRYTGARALYLDERCEWTYGDGLKGVCRAYFNEKWEKQTYPYTVYVYARVNASLSGRTLTLTSREFPIAISYVDLDGARRNFDEEAASFDETRRRAARKWATFNPGRGVKHNTAVYHSLVAPYTHSDADGRVRIQGDIHRVNFTYYSFLSFWDIWRTWTEVARRHAPDVLVDITRTSVKHHEVAGIMPRWTVAGMDIGMMPGVHSITVGFQTWRWGLIQPRPLFEAARATMLSTGKYKEGHLDVFRAHGGFIPCDGPLNEVVSSALELSVNAHCVAELAAALGEDDEPFRTLSRAWTLHFDGTYLVGRTRGGGFCRAASPWDVRGNKLYTEGNAASWFFRGAACDTPAFSKTRERELFEPRAFHADKRDVTGRIGAYAHGNEVAHGNIHSHVEDIMNMYTDIPGNDDAGAMSAWYVTRGEGFDAWSKTNVISVSLYGNSPRDTHEHLARVEASVYRLFGDNWEFRIYTDHVDGVRNITKSARIIRAPTNIPNPMAWRFLPALDPTVSVFLSRDTDNELIARDRDAVFDWLYNSTRDCHVMRDHPLHVTTMLGGMWGFRNAGPYREHFKALIYDPHSHKGADQYALTRHLWPHVKCLAHDSYLCGRYRDAEWRPFPTRRDAEGHVVGAWTLKRPCPMKCRKHPEWIYC